MPIPLLGSQGAEASCSALASLDPVEQDAPSQHIQVCPELGPCWVIWVGALEAASKDHQELLLGILCLISAGSQEGAKVGQGLAQDGVGR